MIARSLIKIIMLAANLVVVAGFFAAILGSHISPATIVLPAYFTLTFPLFIVLNVFFVVFWLIARKFWVLLSLITLFTGAKSINAVFPIHFGKTKTENTQNSDNKTIKILSYNTMMNGKVERHNPPKKINPVIEYILNSDADIICIQEFFVMKDNYYLTQKDINKLFKAYPYKHIQFDFDNDDRKTGLATFSKYPIIKKEEIKYKSRFNASQFSDIVIENDTIRIINNHLESNRFTGNDLLLAHELKNDFDTDKLTETTKYLSNKLGIAYRTRARQAVAVRNVIDNTRHRVIVCSDMNDVPISYAYTKIKGNLQDAYTIQGNGFGWTFNSSIYKVRIDYIFADSTFKVSNFKLGKIRASDHYPIECELEIKKIH